MTTKKRIVVLSALIPILAGGALHAQTSLTTLHGCSLISSSGNSPHLFDVSETYRCDEGDITISGQRKMVIEYGYVFETEMGKPSVMPPRIASTEDYRDYDWCADPQPWDPNQKQMCGDKPVICFDGKLATWDPAWQGYSCVTLDHQGGKEKP